MDIQVHVDLMGNGGVQGEVAQQFMTNGKLSPSALRPWVGSDGRCYITAYMGGDPKSKTSYKNIPIQRSLQAYTGTLRRDEWNQLDQAILQISRERLGGIQDLLDKNLIYRLGNAMGTTVLEYHDISDAMSAKMSMDGVTRGEGDRPVFGTNYLPIPILHADFEINHRVLEASRKLGNPLDTAMVESATRRILEKREDLLFTSTSYTYGGGTIYSYLNTPYRNPVTLTLAWDNASKTGAQILADVTAMKQASIDAKHYGPWMLYIPVAYETVLDKDYVSGYPKTIRQRIMEIDGISGIKVVDRLTANNVLLVQLTSDVVRLVYGMDIQVVEWQTEGNMITKYKVMCIQVPQVRNDQAQNSGVTHLAA